MVKDRLFKKGYSKELVKIAVNDLEAARALARSPNVRQETTFFLVQQSVEKALKALLCYLEKPVPMVHDLLLIIDRLRDDAPKGAEQLVDLSDFASIKRYEEGNFVPTQEELDATISLADKVVSSCRDRINEKS